jgi:hypothetical protein
MKLGKRPVRYDERTLFLSKYLITRAPDPPPTKTYYEYLVKEWGLMKNDVIGDCTVASAGHLIMNWTAHTKAEVVPSDAEIEAAYATITGYDPLTGKNDNGAYELDVLNYWRKDGIAGRKIDAYAALDVKNLTQVKQGIFLFGGVYMGLVLPRSAQTQEVWDVVGSDGGSWGGHAVPVLGYGRHGFACITWGRIKYLSNAFWLKYVEECYAVLSPDWVNRDGIAPNHVDLASLQSDLAVL